MLGTIHLVSTHFKDVGLLVEGGETFTVRFSPVSNVVDRTDPERDEKRQFTITGDNPGDN